MKKMTNYLINSLHNSNNSTCISCNIFHLAFEMIMWVIFHLEIVDFESQHIIQYKKDKQNCRQAQISYSGIINDLALLYFKIYHFLSTKQTKSNCRQNWQYRVNKNTEHQKFHQACMDGITANTVKNRENIAKALPFAHFESTTRVDIATGRKAKGQNG